MKIRLANRKHRPAALTNKKPDKFGHFHADDIVKGSGFRIKRKKYKNIIFREHKSSKTCRDPHLGLQSYPCMSTTVHSNSFCDFLYIYFFHSISFNSFAVLTSPNVHYGFRCCAWFLSAGTLRILGILARKDNIEENPGTAPSPLAHKFFYFRL